MGTELVVYEGVPARNKGGRPRFPWTPELKDEIIELLVCGVTLVEICRMDGMPSYPTIYYEREADPEFSSRLMRAREEGCHALADECKIIADTPQIGRTVTHGPDGVTIKMEDAKAHRHMQIDTRLRLIGKWNSMYGDKKPSEAVTNVINGNVTNVTLEMTTQEAAELYAEKRKALG